MNYKMEGYNRTEEEAELLQVLKAEKEADRENERERVEAGLVYYKLSK